MPIPALRSIAATLFVLTALLFPACGDAATLMAPKGRHLRVAFVITEGATMIDFAGPWEVFQDVHVPERGMTMDEKMPFDLYTVGVSRQPIRTSGGMTVVPDHTFADAPTPDIVVIGAQRGGPGLTAWLRKVRGQAQVVMSVCTGAFHLAEAGLLDGRPATTHHDFQDQLQQRYPLVQVKKGLRWVKSDDRVLTAGGLTSGIDLALHVVALYFGEAAAQRTADYMEHTSTAWKG